MKQAFPAIFIGGSLMPHKLVVLALDGAVQADLSQPLGIFGHQPDYDIQVCGVRKRVRTEFFDLKLRYDLSALKAADTIIVPGVLDVTKPMPSSVAGHLQRAAKRGARIASICTGAFVLAEAGLLHGLTATTHWSAMAEFQQRFPDVHVDRNVLFVDNGQILCSAGAASGIDLCLHLLREDHGAAIAAQAARMAVVPLAREGGQAQFVAYDVACSTDSLDALLEWIRDNLDKPLSVSDIAAQGALSMRTLARRFHEQTGTTPLRWLQEVRVRRAQYLLEMTTLSIEEITTQTGFGTANNLRDRFVRVVGVPPSAYRLSFAGRHNGVGLTLAEPEHI